MFIRPCYRTKNGKRHACWALVESIWTQRGPRQQVLAYLGQMDVKGRMGLYLPSRLEMTDEMQEI